MERHHSAHGDSGYLPNTLHLVIRFLAEQSGYALNFPGSAFYLLPTASPFIRSGRRVAIERG